MTDDQTINEIKMFLGAFPANLVREALKGFNFSTREQRLTDGWRIWTEPKEPPKALEWKMVGTLTYVRKPLPPQEQTTVKATATRKAGAPAPSEKVKTCPDCGAEAFAQKVCPACAKGKAGIRKQYICGENSDHVFYTG